MLVTIARANSHVTYPARFQLIAAMNPFDAIGTARVGQAIADRPAHGFSRRGLVDAMGHVAAEDDHPATPAALARRIGRSRPATTALVGRLVAQGYVERVPHPDDGRAVILKGAARVGEATATFFIPYAGALDRVLAAHDPAAVDRSVALLDEVTAAIRDLVKR